MTDEEIKNLIGERKDIKLENYQKLFSLSKVKGQHKEHEVPLLGINQHEFVVKIRQSAVNPLDFSVIFCFIPKEKNRIYRLRRYNGKSHQHKNSIEKSKFYDFHIHTATQRYEDLGSDEETYAEPCNSYSDLRGAIETMLTECNVTIPAGAQLSLT